MTWLAVALCARLLTAGRRVVAAHRRYLTLRRKHKTLPRLDDHAKQQWSTLWASKKP